MFMCAMCTTWRESWNHYPNIWCSVQLFVWKAVQKKSYDQEINKENDNDPTQNAFNEVGVKFVCVLNELKSRFTKSVKFSQSIHPLFFFEWFVWQIEQFLVFVLEFQKNCSHIFIWHSCIFKKQKKTQKKVVFLKESIFILLLPTKKKKRNKRTGTETGIFFYSFFFFQHKKLNWTCNDSIISIIASYFDSKLNCVDCTALVSSNSRIYIPQNQFFKTKQIFIQILR